MQGGRGVIMIPPPLGNDSRDPPPSPSKVGLIRITKYDLSIVLWGCYHILWKEHKKDETFPFGAKS